MKRKIVKALMVLFFLFLLGGGFSVLSLRQINKDLSNLIALHRVEIIRQDLVINVQSVQTNLFTVGTGFGKELDDIVESVMSLDRAVMQCSGCHHSQSVEERINNVGELIEQYKEALSAYITTTANEERIEKLKIITADIGEMILDRTREMAFIANKSLQKKTEDAVSEVVVIQKLIIATLLGVFIIGFIVAVRLTNLVVSPLGRLVVAAKEVSSGNLGYTTGYRDDTEIGDFAATFDEMSLSLKESHEKILSYTNKLSLLTRVTVPLYAVSGAGELLHEALNSLGMIIDAEHFDIVVINEGGRSCRVISTGEPEHRTDVGVEGLRELFERSERKAVIDNRGGSCQALCEGLSRVPEARNSLIVWLVHKDELRGALRVVNKMEGIFDSEDVKVLSIFANNFTVAMDNAKLYEDLRRKMEELKETQQQLIQAAKLAAIGELASNVAHEINNPLTSILGYAELAREETDMESVMKDIDIIEQESLRAREIVRQLLEFSRKRPLKLEEIDINDLLKDVLKLAAVKLKPTAIRLDEKYGDIPSTMADANQLKQVFINLINNGIAAMHGEGVLTIETGMRGNHIIINVSDTGEGIDEKVLPRIFEPFFTTKAEKGTGLGLSVSYQIIEAHGGMINVRSSPGEGSTFTITLPVRRSVSHVSL